MSRDDPQMKIRLPADLKARIEDASVANNRTMNAEIVARLEASFTQRLGPILFPGMAPQDLEGRIKSVQYRLMNLDLEITLNQLDVRQASMLKELLSKNDPGSQELATAKSAWERFVTQGERLDLERTIARKQLAQLEELWLKRKGEAEEAS